MTPPSRGGHAFGTQPPAQKHASLEHLQGEAKILDSKVDRRQHIRSCSGSKGLLLEGAMAGLGIPAAWMSFGNDTTVSISLASGMFQEVEESF